MIDGYLTKEARAAIHKWRPGSKDCPKFSTSNLIALLDLIEANTRWPEFSIEYSLEYDIFGSPVIIFEYHTGGWSGHEDMICELEKTFFWMFCWKQSSRGGHYKFEINPNPWSADDK